jgi:DNA-binding NarL/FixJ family response regulator
MLKSAAIEDDQRRRTSDKRNWLVVGRLSSIIIFKRSASHRWFSWYNSDMVPTRIILADDHDLVRAGIRNALQDHRDLLVVAEVGNGPELVRAVEALRPDLLIIDIAMPDFEPITAIRRIRQRYPEVRILVVSAHADNVYVHGLLREGVNGYHLKDQPLDDLRLAVERVLAGKRWVSSPLLDRLIQPAEVESSQVLKLSGRQMDILRLLVDGLDNRALATRLHLSVKTVETHLTRLYRQLKVQSRLEAVHYAYQHPEIMNRLVAPTVEQAGSTARAVHTAILVVDDSFRYRQQMERMIGRIYPLATIYEAANTAEALALTQRFYPPLAFVDVVLGDESGIHCAQKLKAVSSHLRIVLMSAYPDREFHRRGLEVGASAFVDKKDMDANTLHQIIMDAIG